MIALWISTALASPGPGVTPEPPHGAPPRSGRDARQLCEDTTDEALAAADAMREAFVQAKSERFVELYRQLDGGVACLERRLDPSEVDRLLIAYGLFSSIASPDDSRAAWSTIKQRGAWDIASLGLPEEAHVVRLFRAAPVLGATTPLRSPAGGWEINGVPTSRVPRSAAFVAQGRHADQRLWWSGFVTSTVEVPEPPLDLARLRKRQRRMRIGGSSVAGALITGAASTFTVAAVNIARLEGGKMDPLEAGDRARTYNTLVVTSGVMGGIGLGLGVASWTLTGSKEAR